MSILQKNMIPNIIFVSIPAAISNAVVMELFNFAVNQKKSY